jgi:hypothetical protein
MKRTVFLRSIAALALMTAAILFFSCNNSSNPAAPPEEIKDDPAAGIMTAETASKVFEWRLTEDGTGVEIVKLKDLAALSAYLNTPARQAVPEVKKTLVIKQIAGKPVKIIAAGAFSVSDPEVEDDITTVVGTVILPDTIESLGENLFEGTSESITLEVPAAVQEKIPDQVEAAAGGADVEVEVIEPEEPVTPEEPGTPPGPPPSYSPTTVTIKEIGGLAGFADPDFEPPATVETAQFTGTVTWSPALNAGKLDADTLYTATITLAPKTGYTLIGVPADFFTVDGAKATNAANSGTVTAAVIRVDDVAGLATAVTAAKGYAGGGAVIYLSPGFYGDANTAGNFIVVDADNTDNGIPYTIKGTGNTDTLTVGIVLANDNVTLDGVKIAVDTATKAANYLYPLPNTYKAAITIERRSNAATAVSPAPAPTNVTIQNCDISYDVTDTSGAAGIIAYGAAGIEIASNEITATNTSPGNTGTSASAIAVVIPSDATGTPNITANTLKGGAFDFYITVLSASDMVGVQALFDDNFGTATSTWVAAASTDSTSFYKQLVTALLPQSKGSTGAGDGFGRLFLSLGGTLGSTGGSAGFALEYYEIDSADSDNAIITAINYWSPGLSGGGTEYNDTVMTSSTEDATNTTGTRGRLELQSGNFTPNGTFKWTWSDTTGTNL